MKARPPRNAISETGDASSGVTLAGAAQPRQLMKRCARWFAWGACALLSLLCLLVAISICYVNTGSGRVFVTRQVRDLTGDTVRINGLKGRFPTKVTLSSVQLRDQKGVWLEAEGVTLRWRPLAMMTRRLKIDALTARRLHIVRSPVGPENTASQSPSTAPVPAFLHVGLRFKRLEIDQIVVGQALFGSPMTLRVRGDARLDDLGRILEGVDLTHLPTGQLHLALERLDQKGHLRVGFDSATPGVNLHLDADDPTNHFLSSFVTRPKNAPVRLLLDARGPPDAVVARLDAQLGNGRLNGNGRVDFVEKRADIALSAKTPQVEFVHRVGWEELDTHIIVKGAWRAPLGDGTLSLRGLHGPGLQVSHFGVQFSGQQSGGGLKELSLTAEISEPRFAALPDPVFGKTPISLKAQYHPEGHLAPLALQLDHPLFELRASTTTAESLSGSAHYILRDLSVPARMSGIGLHGDAAGELNFHVPLGEADGARLSDETDFTIKDMQTSWGGVLLGRSHLSLSADQRMSRRGVIYQLKNLSIAGSHVSAEVNGALGATSDQPAQLHLKAHIPALSDLNPALRGTARLDTVVKRERGVFRADTRLDSRVGINGSKEGPLALRSSIGGLPDRPQGSLDVSGSLDGAPLNIVARLDDDRAWGHRLTLSKLEWRGVSGQADLKLGNGKAYPTGTATVRVADLNHFSGLLGQKISGHLDLGIATQSEREGQPLHVGAHLTGTVRTPQLAIENVSFNGSVEAPETTPAIDARLDLNKIVSSAIKGRVQATIKGSERALSARLGGKFTQFFGADLSVLTELTADLAQHFAHVKSLSVQSKDVQLRASSPANLFWGDRVGVEDLSLKLTRPGVNAAFLSGRALIKPQLSVQLALKALNPAFAAPFVPGLALNGLLNADASIKGTLQAPQGQVNASVRNLGALKGDAASLPPASIDLKTSLKGRVAALWVAAQAGPRMKLQLAGSLPLSAVASLDIATQGRADLGLLNAITAVSGISIHGQAVTDLRVRGNLEKPLISGHVVINHGSLDDYAHGVRVHDLGGEILGATDALILRNVAGRAGPGVIRLHGKVGLFQKGQPVDLTLDAKDARPISSDILTAVIDASLHLTGQMQDAMTLTGQAILKSVDVNIPDALPVEVPQLKIIRADQAGKRKDVTADASHPVALNLTVTSPGQFYVRGHGLDAEMMGKLHIAGTAAAPNVVGQFDMRRGDFNLAGVDLTFSEGVVGFNGAGVTHRLDPTLNFRADRNVQGTIASLTVTGVASAPRIGFSSAPSLPQDQVLAMLLFGRMTPQLSTSQMASVAAALAQLAGGAKGFDPLTRIRNALGLDRLAVGGGSGVGDGGANVEAGKYVVKGVYVGAKQATSGAGTQAQVQVDLTKRLKLNTTVGTGGLVTGFTTPENDPGSSIGLSYGLDY